MNDKILAESCKHGHVIPDDLSGKREKIFSVVNPSRMCQPMGAIYAILGMRNTMPLIHGSQGCSTYMRFQLTRHFREPMEVASTSMSEKTVIYGGEYNLMKALKNISEKQHPDLIGIVSSCLTETIGDDMNMIVGKFRDSNIEKELPCMVPISTPSYAGSHVEGYDQAIKSLVEKLASPQNANHKINIVPGILSPADVREVKRILLELKIGSIILTDYSENLDAPFGESSLGLYTQGTSVDEVVDSANSRGTITLSRHADSAGSLLEKKFDVPSVSGPIPIGVNYTDQFVTSLCSLAEVEVPKNLEKERGRLIDAMIDSESYNYQRRVAIFGEPDFVSGMTQITSEMGMHPTVVSTGVNSPRFVEEIKNITASRGIKTRILSGFDLEDLHAEIRKYGADVLIGNAYGARIASEENIPLYRAGFPIFDRLGAQRICCVGYEGGLQTVDRLTNMILDFYYDESGYEICEKEKEGMKV